MLLAIGSCAKDRASGAVKALRETWLRKDLPVEYRIFYGDKAQEPLESDEVRLDCPDGLWIDLTRKTQAMLKWTLEQKPIFTHIFRCDVDTFVHVSRLLDLPCAPLAHDYYGSTLDTPGEGSTCGVPFDFCHGGAGFWLSRNAARILAHANIEPSRPSHKLQDQWVAETLLAKGILPVHDRRYSMGLSYGRKEPWPTAANDVVTAHLSLGTGKYIHEDMYRAYGRSMKVLIACSTCWRDAANGTGAAIRETWGRQMPPGWDLRFFLGGVHPGPKFWAAMDSPGPTSIGPLDPSNALKRVPLFTSELQGDEVVLNCPDGYFGLPWKTIESLEWALERKYEWIFRIFADTYVFPQRLADSSFFLHDFSGRSFDCPPCPAHPYQAHAAPHGGMGYWTSAAAAKLLAGDSAPTHWGEDTDAGFKLWRAGLKLFHDPRYVYDSSRPPEANRGKLTIHLNERAQKWNPSLMRSTHAEQERHPQKPLEWANVCPRCKGTKLALHALGARCRNCGLPVSRSLA